MNRSALVALVFLLAATTVVDAHATKGAPAMTAADVVALGMADGGKTVIFEGEAVGEPLRADGSNRWVNVLSGEVAIGVVLDQADAERVGEFGRYGYDGSWLRIVGIYNAACEAHGGDRDVHAVRVEVVREGSERVEPIGLWKAGVALGLLGFAAVGGYGVRRARRRYAAGAGTSSRSSRA